MCGIVVYECYINLTILRLDCTYHLCKCQPLLNTRKLCLPLLTKNLIQKSGAVFGVHGSHVGILLMRIVRAISVLCCASDTVMSSRVVMGRWLERLLLQWPESGISVLVVSFVPCLILSRWAHLATDWYSSIYCRTQAGMAGRRCTHSLTTVPP